MVGSKCHMQYDWCPYKKRRQKDTDTQRRPCGHRLRYWSDMSPCQEMPMIANDHRKLRRSREGFFPRPIRVSMALLTPWFWIYSLQNCKRRHLCCVKPPSWCFSGAAAAGNKFTIAYRISRRVTFCPGFPGRLDFQC